MKDRFEVRFTIATGEVKSLKPFAKFIEPYAKRLAEALTKKLEEEVKTSAMDVMEEKENE